MKVQRNVKQSNMTFDDLVCGDVFETSMQGKTCVAMKMIPTAGCVIECERALNSRILEFPDNALVVWFPDATLKLGSPKAWKTI